MIRLPLSFEQEVLSKHGIYWAELCSAMPESYVDHEHGTMGFTNKHKIAAYALEAMKDKGLRIEIYKGHINTIRKFSKQTLSVYIGTNECIFKAVKEIWG